MNTEIPFGHMPDPRRAHGAWVYLFACVGAGALLSDGEGTLAALLAGTGFAGMFLVASVVAIGAERGRRPLWLGLTLATAAPALALALGAQADFALASALAALPALCALLLALRRGWLAPSVLACGVLAISLSGPAAARAGGATWTQAALLYALLSLFFLARTLRIARALQPGARNAGLGAAALRAQGLREARWTLLWTVAVVLALRRYG